MNKVWRGTNLGAELKCVALMDHLDTNVDRWEAAGYRQQGEFV